MRKTKTKVKPRAKARPKPVPLKMTAEDLRLVAAGKMRMPKAAFDVDELFKIPTGRVRNNEGIQAVLKERT